MKTKNQETILLERIVALQKQQEIDLQELKAQYNTAIESFSILNLLKTSLQDVLSTPHLTSNIIHGAINMGTQYLSKSLLKSTPKLTTGWLGKIIQLVTKKATKV